MLVTPQEAANALKVHPDSIKRWYTQTRHRRGPGRARKHASVAWTIDTEVLAANLEMDHRFLMAFIAGYDMALTPQEADAMLATASWDKAYRHCAPVFKHRSLRYGMFTRYSLRRALQVLETRNASHRLRRTRSRPILPPPDTLPPNEWGFVSALVTKGKGLPSGRRTYLEDGRASSLPIRDGQERGNGRSS